MKRLSQLEATAIFTIEQTGALGTLIRGRPVFPANYADRLVKRGLVRREEGGLRVTEEGRASFRKWEG